jgi:hypothetical protein
MVDIVARSNYHAVYTQMFGLCSSQYQNILKSQKPYMQSDMIITIFINVVYNIKMHLDWDG